MRNKRILFSITALGMALLVAIGGFFLFRSRQTPQLTILDATGNPFAVLEELSARTASVSEESRRAYLEIVLAEAIQTVSDLENCSEKQAKRKLLYGGYTIETAFREEALQACQNAYQKVENTATPFAAVVTTADGRVLAAFSSPADEKNYVLEKTQPYSAFKPLSVYAPAIESGKVSWSSMYMDAPVKKVAAENGTLQDWPTNSNGKYQQVNVSVCDGIKYSLNTIAVRCLMETGVTDSMDFLQENFNIDLTHEQRVANTAGEEEILANIGLGYLKNGMSPLDMAGFYQIFSTGGKYERPYTILSITEENGEPYFTHTNTAKQVITEETAFIMNKLLQNTLTSGGTAEKAQYEDLKIGGKTGTGSDLVGNWFVGYTPEYVCSIWHGKNARNQCAELFPAMMEKLQHDRTKTYPTCDTVVQIPYCPESGKRVTLQCSKMEIGYYSSTYTLEKCNLHSK